MLLHEITKGAMPELLANVGIVQKYMFQDTAAQI
jgi:hypothetical protein